jgi:tetratricopeptide (TPR) repeat protein
MKIFGIPVKVDPFFLLLVGFLGASRLSQPVLLVEWLVVVFVSILIHELGHALTVRSFGLSPQIQLYGMGGLTSWTEDRDVSPLRHIVISLAGPCAGFLFGGAVFAANTALPDLFGGDFGRVLYLDLLWVNFGWGIFNLLPVMPLDGGNALYSFEQLVSKKTAGTIARVISFLVAASLALLALSARWLWVALLMTWFAWDNGVALFQLLRSYRDRSLLPQFNHAEAAVENRDGVTAARLAQEVFDRARSDVLKREAQKVLARAYIVEGDLARAGEELHRLETLHGPEAAMAVFLSFKTEEWPLLIPLIETSYQTSLRPELGMILAQALIEAGRYQEALPLIADPRQSEYAPGLYAAMQHSAFRAGQYETSIEAGRLALDRGASPVIAYNIACAHARMGRNDEAMEWVKRAVEAGFNERETLGSDPDIAALRVRPEFDLIWQKLGAAKA